MSLNIYIKDYGFLSFAKNMSKDIGKNLSGKYSKKLIDSAKLTTDEVKLASKRAIQKTAEATGDLIGNKIADKITAQKAKKAAQKKLIMKYQKKDVYLQKKDNKLLMN